MDELVRWLGEQLDEDEAAALAWPDDQREWEVRGSRTVKYASGSGERVTAISVGGGPLGWERITVARDSGQKLGAHIAAHDPARVLREIDAKRQIIALWKAADEAAASDQRYAESYGTSPDGFPAGRVDALEGVVRLLALPYSDRPGYRDTWRP